MDKKKAVKIAKQVNVSLDGEVRRMFEWLRHYDPTMNSDSKAASYLMELGVSALKNQDALNHTPIDQGTFDSLVEAGNASIRESSK